MNFEQTMEKFFSRYSPTDRKRAEQWPGYAQAVEAKDATKAQALACEALEGSGPTKAQAKEDRSDKSTARRFDQFDN